MEEKELFHQEVYKLNNGVLIPKVGFGTWQIPDAVAEDIVCYAINEGYIHIDTAIAYGNEEGVGRGIKKSNAFREDLFITTKIPAEVKSYEEAKKCIEESLKRLDVSYIDLLLIHAPKPWDELWVWGTPDYYKENLEVWRAMEEAYDAGLVKAIGVSNFRPRELDNLLAHCRIKPVCNQVRAHIGHVPMEDIEYAKAHDMLIEAYSPNATGRMLHNDDVAKMAEKYGVSIPQLGVKFDLQLGLLPLPKTVHEEFAKQNIDLDFEITGEDMQILLQIPEI